MELLQTSGGVDGPSAADRKKMEHRLGGLQESLDALPELPERSAGQRRRAAESLEDARKLRRAFMRRNAAAVYEELTDGRLRSLRLAELAALAAESFPGLVPDQGRLKREAIKPQRHKDGLEIDLGIFFSEVLRHPESGRHLVHTMTEPTPQALALLDAFRATGVADLGPVEVRRVGSAGHVTFRNHQVLNAEDNDTVTALEFAVDLVLLDDAIEVGILRGAPVEHPKWAGQRIFGAGINLSALYEGRISLVEFFLNRELGALHKIFRGHPTGGGPDDELAERREKPWIAAVDTFAIGGGCQMLLVADRVVADAAAYVNLPAGREGIVPGCGVLRLPRFVGEGLARQIIFGSRDIAADSPEGRMLVSDVVPRGSVEPAVQRAVDEFLACGPVGVRANRRALRAAVEPVDAFRRYMATYALDQAVCIHGRDVIANLERTWGHKLSARAHAKGPHS
ncbi:enoyl-CoA hydratase/isomerase family protein [Kitasatospora sp. P5_F3]